MFKVTDYAALNRIVFHREWYVTKWYFSSEVTDVATET